MINRFALLALAALLVPAAVFAQSATALAPASPVPVVSTAPATGASMVRSNVAGFQLKADANAPLVVNSAAAEGLHEGEGVALMAVGGAGLVAGLLVGGNAGTAVALGGVAVGLYGLYEYVR